MLKTVVVLKPREQWPRRISQQELIGRFDAAMKFPGVANTCTTPVRGRIDMLARGMRSSLGLKIAGSMRICAKPCSLVRCAVSGPSS